MWVAWIILGLIVLFGVLLAGLVVTIFVASLIEKRTVRRLQPLEDDERPSSGKAERFHREALDAGLMYFQTFRDSESNLLKMRLSTYLSEDGVVLMVLPSAARSMGFRLYSRMAEGVWLETGEVLGDTDLSGLQIADMLPGCNVQQVLRFHHDRIAAHDSEPVPFDPRTLIDDLYEHDFNRAEATIAAGFARWVQPEQGTWVMTRRGAVRVSLNTLLSFGRTSQQQERAKRYQHA